jgi:hypothetical protein
MASAVLVKCHLDSSSILQQLRDEGFTDISTPTIPGWDESRCCFDPEDYLPAAQNMKLHLKLLWSIIEHRKVSTAVTSNALMTAVGYIYQGHDIGWRHSGSVPFYWALKDTTIAEVERDNGKARQIFFKYERLLNHGIALAKVTTTFINSMSIHLGPTLAWVPAFQISVTLNKISPPSVFIPETTCIHCSTKIREKPNARMSETCTETPLSTDGRTVPSQRCTRRHLHGLVTLVLGLGLALRMRLFNNAAKLSWER